MTILCLSREGLLTATIDFSSCFTPTMVGSFASAGPQTANMFSPAGKMISFPSGVPASRPSSQDVKVTTPGSHQLRLTPGDVMTRSTASAV